ncbi:troponin C-like [Anopheles marshallii]|uniref:troponin C-like n=1 Tax=Anopheles marshallii TaxID=1521116 RepID=UPI00237A9881|nr:troponin C-like [Anopheles marshallii]
MPSSPTTLHIHRKQQRLQRLRDRSKSHCVRKLAANATLRQQLSVAVLTAWYEHDPRFGSMKVVIVHNTTPTLGADFPQDDLTPEQIAILQKAFNSFDREKTGSISSDMVAEILRLMGQPFNSKILEEMIEEVDEDKSGQIEFAEFVTLAAKFIVEEDEEALQKELREAFRLYDKEGNGFIPTTCLREILRELDDQLTDEDLDMMIEEIDSDGSGTVDFDEFMEMMTG